MIDYGPGERLKEAREKAGLTYEQVAEALNVSKEFVMEFEQGTGTTTDKEFTALCKLYGVREAWIWTGRAAIDCRSEEGITIGLIDSVMTTARVLRHRNISDWDIREALMDLASDEDVAWLIRMAKAANGEPPWETS